MSTQRTLSIIKPNAVKKNKIGMVIALLEEGNLKVIKAKMVTLSVEEAESFYNEHKGKPFFNELVDFITSGPAVVQILEGDACITSYRSLMGATNPEEAEEGTIRKKFAESISKNAVHGSDSPESADREIEIMSALF